MPHQVSEISKSCLHQLWGWTYSSTHKGMNTEKPVAVQLNFLCTVSLTRIPYRMSVWQDGGLFTFGDGSWGQLGHGSTNNELLPRRVLELMGTEVSQIACGRYCLSNLFYFLWTLETHHCKMQQITFTSLWVQGLRCKLSYKCPEFELSYRLFESSYRLVSLLIFCHLLSTS